jgi:hypothetical protein
LTVQAGGGLGVGSSNASDDASLSVSGTLLDAGTISVGSPSALGSTGAIDTIFFTLNGGTLNIGDPGSGTAGTVDVSDTMNAIIGTLNVGGINNSGGTLSVHTLNTTATNNVYANGQVEIAAASSVGGTTTVAGGEIKAEVGAPVVLTGTGTVSGTGKLNAAINASFTFDPYSAWTIGLGNPVGSALNDGDFYIDGTLTVNTHLNPDGNLFLDNNGTTSAGSLIGSGDLDIGRDFTWNGGTLAPSGGTTIESSGDFKTLGADPKVLASNFTNMSAFSSLGGTGDLTLNDGATFDNAVGTTDISLPSIASGSPMGGTGLFENTGGDSSTLNFQGPGGSPTVISADFINLGVLEVAGGSGAILSPAIGGTCNLDGRLELEGDLTLEGAVSSPTGLVVNPGGGKLMIGDNSGLAGSLTLSSGYTSVLFGTVEVSSNGTLTGGGGVGNNGTLTLDVGSVASLGSYQQSSTGTLTIQAASGPMGPVYSTLAVSGAAQLAGILSIDFVGGYTPPSGTLFTMLTAGSIGAHFDTTPANMTVTYDPTDVTLTQN